MNVFVIPSWYPSTSNSLNGIFVREQTILLAQHYADMNFGISCWGQNDEDYLLHSRQPIDSISKLVRINHGYEKPLAANVWEFFTPAYSWHQSVLKGNIKRKIDANLQNLKQFEGKVGKVSVLHAHVSFPGGYIAQQLSIRTGIPYIITEHMAPFPQRYHLTKDNKLKPEIREALKGAKKVIAVSSELKKGMSEFINNETPPLVINNFLRISPPKAVKPTAETFKFITICGMIDGKGIDVLLSSIKIAVESDIHINFTMVGEGPLLEKLKLKANALKINDNIQWMGFVKREDILPLISEHHAHILCSHYESFGVVYIEAMAMGLPNLAAAIGGPLDIIDQDTGVLVDQVQPELIAEKILWMKNNCNLFNPELIRKSFEDRFSVEAVAPKIRAVYESLL